MNIFRRSHPRRVLALALSIATASSLLVAAPATASTTADAATDASAQEAARGRVSYTTWIRRMNNKADMSGSDFIRTYSTPQHFDWSSDGCSVPGPWESRFGFKWACYRHDFGYRNLKRAQARYGVNAWRWHNKAVADWQFLEDALLHCRLNWSGSERDSCYSHARTYYSFVSTFGDFDSTFNEPRFTYLR